MNILKRQSGSAALTRWPAFAISTRLLAIAA
jgi:hypothetical protein